MKKALLRLLGISDENQRESNQEKPVRPSIGDVVIFDIILSKHEVMYNLYVPKDMERKSGVVTNVSNNAICVDGYWYLEGYSIGDIIIKTVIPSPQTSRHRSP